MTSLSIAALSLLLLAAGIGIRRRRRDPQRMFAPLQKNALICRAGGQCEYKPVVGRQCRTTTRLQADHVMPGAAADRRN